MAEPSSNDSELEQFDKLWKLLNTPIGELNDQASSLGGGTADINSRTGSNTADRQDKYAGKYGKTPGGKASADNAPGKTEKFASVGRTAEGEPRNRGFSKRHSNNQNPNPNRKQHNFRDTTKRIGFHSDIESSPIGQTDTREKSDGVSLYKPGFFTLVFGVFLPLAAMAFESSTHYMAQTAFDPFPTPNHLLLFSLIPISNFLNWLAVRRNIASLYSVISLSTGMALGIAILYSIMLLPLTPQFALQAFWGVGFLGLAPLLSIPITLMCGHTICQLSDRQKTFFDAHQLKHLGHTIILVMVLAVELPSTLTRMHLGMADQGNQQAIQWLRQWGSQDVLLRACYERSGEATDILGTLAEQHHPVQVANARDIFYRVTGVSFNSVPIPASFRGTIKHAGLIEDPAGLNDGVKDEFDLDPDIAGELVSGVARGLSVSDSSIAGSLDSSSGVASLDWNFTFENVSTIPREARAKILLPPNAVVTKATLWLDDLQRETVIQERDLARNTYVQSVTSHKRDPLLVSMAGKDSVLVQCYPVVKGTKTKIRLHIVAPLVVSSKTEESLVMPTFEERNFAITIPHKIDLSSKSKISLTGTDSAAAGRFTQLKKELDNSVMSRFEAVVRVSTDADQAVETLTIRPPQSVADMHKEYFSLLPASAIGPAVRAMSLNNSYSAHKYLTVIVDKSVSMEPYIADIVNGLKGAPKSLPITIVEVKDGSQIFCTAAHSDQNWFQAALKSLSESKCAGGQSAALVLSRVLGEASSASTPVTSRSDVLWIHAAQPIANHPVEYLRNILRSNQAASLYDLQVASGPNVILPESYDYPKLHRIVRTGSLSGDIATFIENYAKNQIRRSATKFAVKPSGTGTGANTDLAQVQAYKLAMGRYQAGDKWGAYDLASRYHLVTPVSSAVVTDEQPIVDDKLTELVEKKAVDEVAQDFEEAVAPIAPPSPQPMAVPPPGEGMQPGSRFQFEPKKWNQKSNAYKMSKTQFYKAPGQARIIDSRPVITDFRTSGKMILPKTKSDSSNAGSPGYFRQAENKQMQGYSKPMEGFERNKESSASKDSDYFSAQSGSSTSHENTADEGVSRSYNETRADKGRMGGRVNSYANSGTPVSPPVSGFNTAATIGGSTRGSSSPSAARPYAVPNRASRPSAAPQSPFPSGSGGFLGGATNGTVGTQSGDVSALMGIENFPQSGSSVVSDRKRDMAAMMPQTESGLPSSGEKKQESDSDQFYHLEKRGESGSGSSPVSNAFSSVMTKLNNLSAAAGPSTMPGSAGMGEQRESFGFDSGAQYDQLKPGVASSNNKGVEPLLIAVGIAFLAMLMVFFRLLAKLNDKDLNTKPPEE